MLFGITDYVVLLYTAGVSTINISLDTSFVVLFLSMVYFSVVFNDPNTSLSISMSITSYMYLFILSVCNLYHNTLLMFLQWSNHNVLFFCKPNVIMIILQISHSLVVILELSGASEIQYKKINNNRWWIVIINIFKSKV